MSKRAKSKTTTMSGFSDLDSFENLNNSKQAQQTVT